MPRAPSDSDLKAEFSKKIKQLLESFTAEQISTICGVSRQMIYYYRDGKSAPSPEVIRRAMENWPQLTLEYRGKVWSLRDFLPEAKSQDIPAVQGSLWDAIEELDSNSLKVEILKKGPSSVELAVQISFSKIP